MFRDVVELISTVVTKDEIGNEVKTETYNEVFAEKNGIARTEFFNAGLKDIKPSLMFKVRTFDYNEENSLRYEGKVYTIYRVYPAKNEMIELYCEVRVNV